MCNTTERASSAPEEEVIEMLAQDTHALTDYSEDGDNWPVDRGILKLIPGHILGVYHWQTVIGRRRIA